MKKIEAKHMISIVFFFYGDGGVANSPAAPAAEVTMNVARRVCACLQRVPRWGELLADAVALMGRMHDVLPSVCRHAW